MVDQGARRDGRLDLDNRSAGQAVEGSSEIFGVVNARELAWTVLTFY